MRHLASLSRPRLAGADEVSPFRLFRLDVVIAILDLITRQKR